MVDKAYAHCAEILKKDEEKVRKIVEFLLENESMSGKQFVACMEDREIGEAEAVSMFKTEEE